MRFYGSLYWYWFGGAFTGVVVWAGCIVDISARLGDNVRREVENESGFHGHNNEGH